MSETNTAPSLACPDCGGRTFSWILHQVQFGTVHRTDGGQHFVESLKMGDVVDDDTDEHDVFCVECKEDRTYDELVVLETEEDTARRPDTC